MRNGRKDDEKEAGNEARKSFTERIKAETKRSVTLLFRLWREEERERGRVSWFFDRYIAIIYHDWTLDVFETVGHGVDPLSLFLLLSPFLSLSFLLFNVEDKRG